MTFLETVRRLRRDVCEGCQEQYNESEVRAGARCEFCERMQALAQQNARLQD